MLSICPFTPGVYHKASSAWECNLQTQASVHLLVTPTWFGIPEGLATSHAIHRVIREWTHHDLCTDLSGDMHRSMRAMVKTWVNYYAYMGGMAINPLMEIYIIPIVMPIVRIPMINRGKYGISMDILWPWLRVKYGPRAAFLVFSNGTFRTDKARFSGDLTWNLGLTYGRYLQFRYCTWNGHWIVLSISYSVPYGGFLSHESTPKNIHLIFGISWFHQPSSWGTPMTMESPPK